MDMGLNLGSTKSAIESSCKWFPYNKGGNFRKWFGNCEFVLRYDQKGKDYMTSLKGHRHDGKSHYFLEGITWTFISSFKFAARYTQVGFVFDVSGSSLFVENPFRVLGFLCSVVCNKMLSVLNPTLNYQVGNLKSLPIKDIGDSSEIVEKKVNLAISFSKQDWDAHETSWDFQENELLRLRAGHPWDLEETYDHYCAYWTQRFRELHRNEEELNRIFIELYGLEDELSPEVPLEEITILQQEGKVVDGALRFQADEVMKQFVSYAVGCMFGRYALDQPGLILANQGETLQDYDQKVGTETPRFQPDPANIIPVLEDEWFEDDITGRFYAFLKATFGEADFSRNLAFVEACLGKPLRKYFARDFYKDHISRYKKRPIYWMFSSPEGHFRALIYLHRYTPDELLWNDITDYPTTYQRFSWLDYGPVADIGLDIKLKYNVMANIHVRADYSLSDAENKNAAYRQWTFGVPDDVLFYPDDRGATNNFTAGLVFGLTYTFTTY
jgi:hypothetical protein